MSLWSDKGGDIALLAEPSLKSATIVVGGCRGLLARLIAGKESVESMLCAPAAAKNQIQLIFPPSSRRNRADKVGLLR